MNYEMFTIPQAAKHCAISRWTLLKCVKSGELKASRTPGGHYRILKKDLEDFIIKKGMYPLAFMGFFILGSIGGFSNGQKTNV